MNSNTIFYELTNGQQTNDSQLLGNNPQLQERVWLPAKVISFIFEQTHAIKHPLVRDYDFLHLSPPEFEQLCQDLLQRHLGKTFESFPEGKDQGIDLRCVTEDGEIVVQCKRYSDFKSLLKALTQELVKVKALNPHRYIIATSLGLSPAQKDMIVKVFKDYIRSTADILGNDDLNNLINLYPEIEKKHFKLWLPSVAVLENVLHSELVNEALFEWTKIEETLNTYVYNESYDLALEMLNEKGYVILSGNPGVGKTTLARILVYNLMSVAKYDEFIYLSSSINDGYARWKPGVHQVFFYDDFLGSNFLGQKHLSNEDQRVLRFIEQVSASKDKILILTTREYILSQAKMVFEAYNHPLLEAGKCMIDVGYYSEPVRAKILYNHLYFSKLPEEYVTNLIDSGSYQQIISHAAFSPRIIQAVSAPEFWKDIAPDEFSEMVLKFLDYPETIWLHAYENQIAEFSKCILAIMATMKSGLDVLLLDDVRIAAQQFVKKHSGKYQIKFSEPEMNKCIRELNNTFISAYRAVNGGMLIEFKNPGIVDFLFQYLEDNRDFVEDIMSAAVFLEQLLSEVVLKDWEHEMHPYFGLTERDFSPGAPVALIKKRIIEEWDQLESGGNPFRLVEGGLEAVKRRKTESEKLHLLITTIPMEKHPDLREFSSRIFFKLALPADKTETAIGPFLTLLDSFKDDYELDEALIIKTWFGFLETDEDFFLFERFMDIFPDAFDDFMSDAANFRDGIEKFIADMIATFPDGLSEDQVEAMQDIVSFYGLKSYKPVKELMTKARKMKYKLRSGTRNAGPGFMDEWEEQKKENKELFKQLKNRPGGADTDSQQ